MKHIHFIAIGGAAMHNLAIALKNKGYFITGSDDEIFEPSKSRLQNLGLLPSEFGWFPEKINQEIDTIILGMHAKADNPELLKAIELGLNVVSYPEFLYSQTSNKKRVVVAGSHGKTTTTAMILHVLKTVGMKFDYMVGSQIDGFDLMVGLYSDSEIAVFEGDEYLSSPIDRQSKFLWYKPDIAILTGIEWDHINVFPTFEEYVNAFRVFVDAMPATGRLFWFEGDSEIYKVLQNCHSSVQKTAYKGLKWEKLDGKSIIKFNGQSYDSHLFGDHNFQNMNAAFLVCKELGIAENQFFKAMHDFKGANRRLQLIKNTVNPIFYDFAHAPSKVRATVAAVKQMFPERKIVACLELHTFSSLNHKFIPLYKNTLNNADEAYVYFNSEVLKHKKMPEIDSGFIQSCFNHPHLSVATENLGLFKKLETSWQSGAIILIMSSGNFGGFDPIAWANTLV